MQVYPAHCGIHASKEIAEQKALEQIATYKNPEVVEYIGAFPEGEAP